ncbi:MAG: alpha/beta hydrolase [Sphingomonadales bacterium]|nr:alpha/beta hydrolase [Sphingomonadales bacterium]
MTETELYVRPDVKAFLQFLNGVERPSFAEIPLADARDAYRTTNAIAEEDARPLAVIHNLSCPGPAGDIALRLYDPRETRGRGPVIVYYHGGGFTIGDLDSHHAFCSTVAAEMDLPVVSVHYRLAPEHPFPAAPDDAEAATRWVASAPAELGLDVAGVIPMGDSAGGNLAIVVTQALMARPADVPVVLQVPLYPATDEDWNRPSMHSFAEGFMLDRVSMQWFGDCYAAQSGNPRAYPLGGHHEDMPPTVLVTAGLDPIRDGGRAYAAALVQAGSTVHYLERHGIIHGFVTLRKALPSTAGDLKAIFAAMHGALEGRS